MKSTAILSLIFVGVICFGIATSGCLEKSEPVVERKSIYERQELKTAIRNKPKSHVAKAFGEPNEISKVGDLDVWKYRNLT